MNPRRRLAAIAVLSTALAGGCAAAVDPAPVAPAPITRAPVAPAAVAPPLVAPAPGSEKRSDFISVTGTGKVTVRPDTALLEMGAEGRARSVGDATAPRNSRSLPTRLMPRSISSRFPATVTSSTG